MDPKVNGQLQEEWGWWVAFDLFLGGVAGGAYTIAAINGFVGEGLALSTSVGLWIAPPALLVAGACLLADLGSPKHTFLAGMKPGTSWISRGVWIITAFMTLAIVHLILHSFTDVALTAGGRTALDVIAVAGIVFAVLTMAYTGALLGASKGIPFWRSGVVPVVFVASGLVAGLFTIMLGMALFNEGAAMLAELRTMAWEVVGLLVLEALAIAFFLHAAFKLPDSRESAERVLRRRSFVIGYLVLGLGAPLVLMLILNVYMAQAGAGSVVALAAIGAVLGLVGRLILRQAVLVCGALPTLNIAGFEFRRIARPKEPKAGIGLLPPQ